MDSKEQLATVQIGKEYIPILKKLAKSDGRSMRKYIETYIVQQAVARGILVKKPKEE